jgi:hypothetical protein
MFYAEFGVTVYPTHRSIHLTLLLHLYEEWCNVRLVRRVSYDHVVWC